MEQELELFKKATGGKERICDGQLGWDAFFANTLDKIYLLEGELFRANKAGDSQEADQVGWKIKAQYAVFAEVILEDFKSMLEGRLTDPDVQAKIQRMDVVAAVESAHESRYEREDI